MSSDTLTSPPLRTFPRPRVRHVLHVLFPRARSHLLATGPTTIGRTDAALTFADDRALSRAHAELTLAEGRLHVRDLASHNGSWRNGLRIEHAPLVDGDVLRLGDTFLLYRIEPVELIDADVPSLLGVSPAIRALRADIARVAPTRATVVLLGETGTGKSLAARAIHAASGRRGEFVQVNCAAIPESVAESLLFGHKAGAFTDAKTDSPGVFRAANRGTLFLDEVGLLSPATQARLLLALDSGEITPVGATTPVAVDVRVVVATNEDLSAAVAARSFRADLYGRLAEVTLQIPPLRQRREDLLPLLASALGPRSPPLTVATVGTLLGWHWPYNVREIEKLASELRIRGEGLRELGPELLGERFTEATPVESAALRDEARADTDGPPDRDTLVEWLRDVEGNVSELGRRVGRSTKQIYRWCSRYALDPAQYRR
ncbi:MAG: sigma 54-interacting transcriptional regulator [Pseudomonadota bacterium]|nr:sigma 54-interacting transcriptional regulator [Pseudomonadota bacterium]